MLKFGTDIFISIAYMAFLFSETNCEFFWCFAHLKLLYILIIPWSFLHIIEAAFLRCLACNYISLCKFPERAGQIFELISSWKVPGEMFLSEMGRSWNCKVPEKFQLQCSLAKSVNLGTEKFLKSTSRKVRERNVQILGLQISWNVPLAKLLSETGKTCSCRPKSSYNILL